MTKTELTYDAATKQQIKNLLYGHLYDPTKEQFNKRLKSIVVNNSLLFQNGQHCFRYKGEVCFPSDVKPPFVKPINSLHPSLISVMDEYLDDLDKLNTQELPYVLNYITEVLNSSEYLPDYFKLLPSSIHPVIQKMIDSCSCRSDALSHDKAECIKSKNVIPIELMKQRMVLNLLC